MVVATYFYYENMRRTMHTAIISYLLKSIFLNCPRFFTSTNNLNTVLTPTEMKQNLLH